MTHSLPPLPSVRAFEAAARHGSFARAAVELGTTAASVSYHVRQLEREIRAPLFVRGARSVTLTELGRSIADDVGAVFDSLRQTFVRAVDANPARLALTTLPTLGTSWLMPRLAGFRALHPELTVELDLSDAAHELGAGKFDAAIRNGEGDWPGLRAIKLFPSLFTPLCSPRLKAAALETLADPFATGGPPLLGRLDWWRRWYEALGFPGVDLSARLGTVTQAEYLAASAAVAGDGVTIGSPILLAEDIRSGRLVPAHDLIARDGRHFWFTYPAVSERSPKIAAFRQWLTAQAATARRAL
jgi:LysR family glycine cleavage system transcriptional activator